MTTYTIKTHKHEADAIARGDKMYLIRKSPMVLGSRILFTVIDGKQKLPHTLDDQVYAVSYVDNGEPLQEGVSLYGIRRVK